MVGCWRAYVVHVVRTLCVRHIKPLFLPVDIQHTQCPRRFFLLERYNLCGHKTTTLAATMVLYCNAVYKQSRQCDDRKNKIDKRNK